MALHNGDSTRPSCRVLIIGGGLAGLATAIAVTLAGHKAVVFERMPVLREVGAGIQLPPNSTVLLKEWGVLEAIRGCSVIPPKTIIRSYREGLVLAVQDFGAKVEQVYNSPYLLIHRADLHRILLQRAESLGAIFRPGADIASADIVVSKPSIRLSCGETFEGDLILGADGERSICREKLLGHDDLLRSSGDLIYRITVKVSDLRQHKDLFDLVDPPNINYWMGPESHAVSYVMKKDDLLNVVLSIPQEPGDETQYGVQPATPAELKFRLGSWDQRLIKILEMNQSCAKWSLLQSNENKDWTHPAGQFLLIGDSAHAMLPYLAQGAAQAFEDAAVLGTLFSKVKHKSQIPDILDVYRRLRLDRTLKVMHRSRDMRGVFGMPDGPAQQERDRQIARGAYEGSPIALADPVFQRWLWGYNAITEAEEF